MDISSLRKRRDLAPLSVSELNGYIKGIFECDTRLSKISVRGEISNFVSHRSGHLYFTLKDTESQLKAVMFRSSAMNLKFMPENGMKVIARGSVSVYASGGTYQLYVTSIEPDGIGALYLAYEQLKEKLTLEGLFSPDNKLPIPKHPRTVGVITSPTGAAVRDIINVAGRRYPLAKLYLYPSLVQGDGAVENLVRALDYFESTQLVDVIIIGRGGGSIEDLWAFNSEILARKIFSMSIPVISAVGHETDFTICDFVSDLRAPTPSAAAELAVPDAKEILMRLDSYEERLSLILTKYIELKRERLNIITEREVFKNPTILLKNSKDSLSLSYSSLIDAIKTKIKDEGHRLSLLSGKLDALSPLSVLSRGYAIPYKDNSVIKSTDDVKVGDELSLKVSDGRLKVSVIDVKKEKRNG